MPNILSQPPIYDNILKDTGEYTYEWQNWINRLHSFASPLAFLFNEALVLNPDFHWSRVIGNTSTTTDGEFVEKWFVKSNGSAFTITPAFYTSTINNAETGSQRYINVSIPTPSSNDFEIYQSFPNYLSKYHNRKIVCTALLKNNNSNRHNLRFYAGFDTNNDGTDDYSVRGKTVRIEGDQKEQITALLETPTINTDNQNNTVRLKLLLTELDSAVDINIFYIKFEFGLKPSDIVIDHILEKVRIDNA